jgi:hypothetical protein
MPSIEGGKMSTERKNPYQRDQALNDSMHGQSEERTEKTLEDSESNQEKKNRRSKVQE